MGVGYNKKDKRTRNTDGNIIAFAGNPNVGKSTLFNSLTGMKQHTGNWTGKTVDLGFGELEFNGEKYTLVDLPGTYSLMAHSKEEEVARDYICFSKCDAVVVVCDATCLERNLNLVLQISEMFPKMLVCVNLCDEAEKKQIKIHDKMLSDMLGVEVIKTVGRKKQGADALRRSFQKLVFCNSNNLCLVKYCDTIEYAVNTIAAVISELTGDDRRSRFLALRIIENAPDFESKIDEYYNKPISSNEKYIVSKQSAIQMLEAKGFNSDKIKDEIVGTINRRASEIYKICSEVKGESYNKFDRLFDKIFTGKLTGIPIMLAFLMMVFWLTIVGANYPSQALSSLFDSVGQQLYTLFDYISVPNWIKGVLLDGVYNVLTTVISVMLPPMAIFFPMFTLLEDLGYLPRIAYNLDRPFQKCNACGKQALTMCMGFGCNAAGIVGARIIDSPRERLLAIITNNFSPCNGRFPMMIAIIGMFFAGSGTRGTVISAILLAGLIVLGVAVTFLSTRLLSATFLKGKPSSFVLELPSYRRPQIVKVIVRSIYDRTLVVLGRAVSVAAPAGAILWLLSNLYIGDKSILLGLADLLDPIGYLMGLDGVILVGFILGLPANEIVLPIIIMCYSATGKLTDVSGINAMKDILVSNGWTAVTAVNVMLFSLMHWPCSTALLTIKRETGSVGWMVFSAVYPTMLGALTCVALNLIYKLF